MTLSTNLSYTRTPATRLPRVSVIIPAFNTAEFIAETLDSVFAQTFRDFEVIIINDGSPDIRELEQVLVRYRGQIIYLKQENRGLAGARNTGIRYARGEYLAFLDSDDCWLPDYLASQLKLFEDTPLLDVVYSDALYFGDSALAGKTYMQICPSNGPATLQNLIREDCQALASCTVVRRQVVVDAGLFDESFRCCEDYDLWLRILYRGGRMAYQRKVLGKYRSRPGSLSRNAMKMSETLAAVYEKTERTMDLPEETRASLKRQLNQAQAHFDLESGRNSLAAGDFERAKDSLTKANKFFQRAKLKIAILGLQFAPRFIRLAAITRQRLDSRSAAPESIPDSR
jgi:glycosyltransferase involved in cell wall biosynthesis